MRRVMGALFGLILIGGCSEAVGPNKILPGSTLNLACVDEEEVFRAATKVIAQNYRVESLDRERGVIRAVPMEYSSKESVASISDVLVQSNHTFRRVVTVQVRPMADNQVFVSARADVQRHDTAPIAAFANQRQGDDRPAEQRNGSAVIGDRERSEVWTSVRRDYAAEQEVLDQIRELMEKDCAAAPTTAPTPSTQP